MDRLLLIQIEAASGGTFRLLTIWATSPDLRSGRRRTDLETIGQAALPARLDELAGVLCR